MIPFAVSEKKNQWLYEKMKSLGIDERDLEEKFVRSSGRGGQKVNKTSTCVYLKHLRTGIEVKCMKDRSQSINRFLARRELVDKVEKWLGRRTVSDRERQKIRKRNLKRGKRSQQKYHPSEPTPDPSH